jgi:gliding motility-associated lipoprotein GldD
LIKIYIALFSIALLCSSCEKSYLPKPRGFHYISLEKPSYIQLKGHYPYSFLVNDQATVVPDTGKYSEPYWLDIRYPRFNAEIEVTYKPLNTKDENQLSKLIRDARTLVSKHQVKASGIEENRVMTQAGNTAFIFEISGQVPSQLQFYTTDSTRHFLRGALYFKTSTKNDSLAPVIKYIAADIHQLIRSIEWKNVGK